MRPNSPDHGEKIRARLDQHTTVLDRDAAYCNTGYGHRRAPIAQELRIGAHRRLLARAGEEGTEGDIVRALLAGLISQVLRRVAGDADDRRRAYQRARLPVIGIALANVDAVGAHRCGDIRPVVE